MKEKSVRDFCKWLSFLCRPVWFRVLFTCLSLSHSLFTSYLFYWVLIDRSSESSKSQVCLQVNRVIFFIFTRMNKSLISVSTRYQIRVSGEREREWTVTWLRLIGCEYLSLRWIRLPTHCCSSREWWPHWMHFILAWEGKSERWPADRSLITDYGEMVPSDYAAPVLSEREALKMSHFNVLSRNFLRHHEIRLPWVMRDIVARTLMHLILSHNDIKRSKRSSGSSDQYKTDCKSVNLCRKQWITPIWKCAWCHLWWLM